MRRHPVAIAAVAGLAAATLLSACSTGAATVTGPGSVSAPNRTAPVSPGPLPTLTVTSPPQLPSPSPPGGRTLYLTFDDGPHPVFTRQVLDLLDEYDAKATFFVIGKQVASSRALLRAQYAAGHGVANHTWDHDRLKNVSLRKFRWEVQRTQRALESAIGQEVTCLRPPGGAIDKRTRPRAAAYGLDLKLWTTDTHDWKRPGAKVIAKRIMQGAHDGAVILLHDGGGDRRQTVSALKATLPKLQRAGYTFAAMCR